MGVLPIGIEVGHFLNKPRSERICEMCNEETESECHFLFHCRKLNFHRELLTRTMPELIVLNDNREKFAYLCKKPYILGNYILKQWYERMILLV